MDNLKAVQPHDVIRSIDLAFGELPYPGDENIVYDNSPTHLACVKARRKLEGLHWKDVGANRLRDSTEELSFMTPAAFRFYLPAYMNAVLSFPERLVTINEGLIWMMTLTEENRADFVNKFSPLTQVQGRAVVMFLRESASRNPVGFGDAVDAAIVSYWGRFDEDRQ
jgi:hypothetical protein